MTAEKISAISGMALPVRAEPSINVFEGLESVSEKGLILEFSEHYLRSSGQDKHPIHQDRSIAMAAFRRKNQRSCFTNQYPRRFKNQYITNSK
jgi:hypothetical protein